MPPAASRNQPRVCSRPAIMIIYDKSQTLVFDRQKTSKTEAAVVLALSPYKASIFK